MRGHAHHLGAADGLCGHTAGATPSAGNTHWRQAGPASPQVCCPRQEGTGRLHSEARQHDPLYPPFPLECFGTDSPASVVFSLSLLTYLTATWSGAAWSLHLHDVRHAGIRGIQREIRGRPAHSHLSATSGSTFVARRTTEPDRIHRGGITARRGERSAGGASNGAPSREPAARSFRNSGRARATTCGARSAAGRPRCAPAARSGRGR